jgi:DNA-binding NtrC family response regulator
MILLLSSAPLVRSVLKEVLEKAGYVVIATGDLGSAVETVEEHRIDLLITHPYVESIPGYEAAKFLYSKSPHMGVLCVAGIIDDDRLTYRADLQHFEIFPAPFTTPQFLQKVEATLKTAMARLEKQ